MDFKIPVDTKIYFVELQCATSRAPGQQTFIEMGRIFTEEEGISFESADVVREIDMIERCPEYIIKKADLRRFFGFASRKYSNAEEFWNIAHKEVVRINRVFRMLLPSTAEVKIDDIVYVSNPQMTQFQQFWKMPWERAGGHGIVVMSEADKVERWKYLIRELAHGPENILSDMLAIDNTDVLISACISFMSEENFPSYYKVFELIRSQVGNEDKLVELAFTTKAEIRRFRRTAQVYRHANHVPTADDMTDATAKFFVLELLRSYISYKSVMK